MERHNLPLADDDLDMVLSFDVPIISEWRKENNFVKFDMTDDSPFQTSIFETTDFDQSSTMDFSDRQLFNYDCNFPNRSPFTDDLVFHNVLLSTIKYGGEYLVDMNSNSTLKHIIDNEAWAENYSFLGNTPDVNSSQTELSTIPTSILNLYAKVRNSFSDFSFIYTISAQMCQEIMPMNCYVEFKMGLLLSLVSIQTDGSKPALPVVGIGQDTVFANLLMNKIGNLSNRLVTPMNKFQTVVLQNENMIDSCPLLLSRGGVYYLGDWSCLNSTTARKILTDVNCGYVSIDKAPINYPVRSAIWCYWKNYKNNLSDLKTLGTFLKVFGIPFLLEDTSSDTLSDFLLEQAMIEEYAVPEDELSISFEDMKQYIGIVSKYNVDMCSEAEDLLRRYFIASRLDRPECLSEKAYSSLTQMAESFAKLSLHEKIETSDALAAIYMAEHFIKNVFGPGIFPSPIYSGDNNIEDVDILFNNFIQWLYSYVSRFSTHKTTT